jgi:[ribosomal protein S5]-alanine N-acetyltransferase
MNEPAVQVRPIELDDWPAVHAWASRPEACRFQAWGPNTEDETKAFVQEVVDAWAQQLRVRLSYVAVVDGDVLGAGEIKVRSQANRQGEISYIVNPDVWGRGVATAIGQELLRIGFEDLNFHRIVGTCDPSNLASARVLAKLGMTYEGRLREVVLIRSGWRDSETYSILEHEWRGGAQS